MTILLHRQALTFINHGKWNSKTHRYEGGGGAKVSLAPSPSLQQVPDWIGNTDTFTRAEADGFIVRIKQLSPPVEQKPAQAAEEMSALGFGAPNIESVNIGKSKKPAEASS